MKKITNPKMAITTLSFICLIILLGFSTNNGYAQYCAAGSTTNGCNTGDEIISNFTFNTINNTSVCETGMYADYTSMSTDVNLGQTITASITNTHYFGTDQYAVWIDFNHDSIFDASEEFILTGTTLATGSITIPLSATIGSTRMRIRVDYTATNALEPCNVHSYGEVEDYTVNILPY